MDELSGCMIVAALVAGLVTLCIEAGWRGCLASALAMLIAVGVVYGVALLGWIPIGWAKARAAVREWYFS